MKIGEFFVQLGVKADITTVKKFASAIGEMSVETAAAIVAIGAIEYRLLELARQTMDTAIKFGIFQSETGLSAQELQRWQMVAQRVGVSTESVAGTIKTLQKNLVGLRYGGGNYRPFAMLGISPVGKDPVQILYELHNKIKTFPRDYFAYWSGQMGVADEMLRVLELSDQKFNEFMNHAHGLTPRTQAEFEKLKETLTGIGQTIRDFGIDFLGKTLEYVTRFVDAFKEIPATAKAANAGLLLLRDTLLVIETVLDGILSIVEKSKDKSMFGLFDYSAKKFTAWGQGMAEKMSARALKDREYWMTPSQLSNYNVAASSESAANPTSIEMNFYGIMDKPENLVDMAVKAMKREVGINARVQINNNAVKRQ